MNNVLELYYDQTLQSLPPPIDVRPSRALPRHPHAQMHIIYIYILYTEQTNTRSVYYYTFLKPSFCRRYAYARGELMWICAFLWFGFHAQRYLFARCTWREFLLSTRLLTATDIIVGILFSPDRPMIYHIHHILLLHAPLYFKHPTGEGITAFRVYIVCILMKSNNKVGAYNIYETMGTPRTRQIYDCSAYTSTHHQRNPKYRGVPGYIKRDEKYMVSGMCYIFLYHISLSMHIYKIYIFWVGIIY